MNWDSVFNSTTCYIYLGAAFLLLLSEAFIPSMGLLTVISTLFAVAAVISAFFVSTTMGLVLLVLVLVGMPTAIIALFSNMDKLPVGKRLIPPVPDTRSTVDDVEMSKLLGREAITLTPLHPAGIIRVDNRRLDVLTAGEPIPENTPVVIARIEGNRVFVQQKTR